MKHSAILAAAMLAGSAGVALAQQEPPVPPQGEVAPPPPSPGGMTPAPDEMDPMSEGRSADMLMDHPPMGMRRGRGGPHHRAAGSFELRIGEGRSLRVRCGDEPIQACIDAAVPLIDRMSGMTPHSPGEALPPTDP